MATIYLVKIVKRMCGCPNCKPLPSFFLKRRVPRIIVEYFVNRIPCCQSTQPPPSDTKTTLFYILATWKSHKTRIPIPRVVFPFYSLLLHKNSRYVYKTCSWHTICLLCFLRYVFINQYESILLTFITISQCTKFMSSSLFFIRKPSCLKSSRIIISASVSTSLPA